MEIDDEHMDVDSTSYKCFLDVPNQQFKVNQHAVLDVKRETPLPLDSDAKIIKIDSYEKFFAFIEKVEVQKFAFLFVFVVYVPQVTEEIADKIKNDVKRKFNDYRPIVVEIRSNDGSISLVYCKEGNEFVKLDNALGLNQTINLLNDPNQLNFYDLITNILNLKNELCLRILKVFEIQLNDEVEICKIVAKNSNGFKLFHAALEIPFNFIRHYKVPEKSKQLVSSSNGNILYALVEGNIKNLVSFVINNFKSTLDEMGFEYKQAISELAYHNASRGYDIFLYLVEADFPFPPNFNKSVFGSFYNEVLDDREKFIDAITSGDKSILDQNIGRSRIAYDFYNKSAIFIALANKKFEIYSLLQSNGFKPCEKENLNVLLEHLEPTEMEEIYKFNLSNAKKDDKKFARMLTSKAIIHDQGCYEDLNLRGKHYEKIQQFFDYISKIPKLSSVLKIAANSPTTEIHFDFFAKHVHRIHPKYQNTLGLAYPTGTILIGADGDETIVMGTIIHELMHYAIQVVYENSFEPFYVGDVNRKAEIQKCVDEYRTKIDVSDQIVSVVYTYPVDQWILELIVRVPEMMVRFNENKDKLSKCMKFYGRLFKFCDGVFKDIEKFNAEKRRKVRELNKVFGLTSKPCLSFVNSRVQDDSQLIISKIPNLSLNEVIYGKKVFYGSVFDSFILFVNVKKLHISQDTLVEYLIVLNENPDLELIVDLTKFHESIDTTDTQSVNGYLTKAFPVKRKFKVLTSPKTADFVKNFTKITEISTITHSWDDLSDESKIEVLSKTTLEFQNKRIQLSKVVQLQNSDSLFQSGFLSHLFSKDFLSVNKIKVLDDIYIERHVNKKWKKLEDPVYVDADEYFRITKVLREKIETKSYDKSTKRYEIRKIIDRNCDLEEKNLVDDAKDLKYVLISDAAGSGKSRFLIEIGDYIRIKFPYSWVQKVDLNQFIEAFKTIRDNVNFSEFFKTYMLKDFKDYEKLLFDYFFNHHQIFILFDGFDEISPKCKGEVLKLIKSFNAEHGSQLWITTRLHLEIDLKKELNCNKIYSLTSLTKEEQINFFVQYWTGQNITANLQVTASRIVDRLSSITKVNTSNPIGLPQLLITFAENSVNVDKIDEDLLENLFKIYEKSLMRLFQLWHRERGELAMETHQNAEANDASFHNTHKFLSMNSYFEDKLEICGMERNLEVWTDEEIIRCGIVKYFINDLAIFKHETFKESFCSIFIIKSFAKSENWKYFDELFDYFLNFMIEDDFEVIRMFIDFGLKEIRVSLTKLQKFGELLTKKITTDDLLDQCSLLSKNILLNAVREGKENLVDLLLGIVRTLDQELVERIILTKYQSQNIFTIGFDQSLNFNYEVFEKIIVFSKNALKNDDFEKKLTSTDGCLIHLALNVSDLSRILDILTKNCSEKCIKKLLTTRDFFGQSPLFDLESSNFGSFWNCFCNYLKPEERIDEIFKFDSIGFNVFHSCSMNSKLDLFKFLFNELSELDASKMKLIFEIPCKQESFKNRNFLQLATYAKSLDFHKFMWECLMEIYVDKGELTKLILTPDKVEKNNYLHILVAWSNKEIIDFTLKFIKNNFENHKEIFESKGFYKRNLVLKAADRARNNVANQEVLWDFLLEVYGNEFFKTFLEPTDKQGDNLIHIVVAFSTKEVLKFVMDFIENRLEMTEKDIKIYLNTKGFSSCNLIQRAAFVFNQSKDLHDFLWQVLKKYFPKNLETFITYKRYASNLMHVVTSYNSLEICEFTWLKIKELVLPEERDQENYLKIKAAKQMSLLKNCQNRNKDERIIAWIRNLMKLPETNAKRIRLS